MGRHILLDVQSKGLHAFLLNFYVSSSVIPHETVLKTHNYRGKSLLKMEKNPKYLFLSGKNPKKIIDTRVLFACMAGNALEFYDFTLYGFFVAILSPLYFPSSDPMVSLISGFGVFGLGFLMRPLGAVLFGHIGDKYGRKKALSLSIFGIALPTAAIGLLPTYEQIGLFSPLFLILLRLFQGLCAGGEYNGAGLFVVEHAKEGYKGFLGSLLTSSGCLGALLACIVGSIFVQSNLPSWAWRIPFLFGFVIGFVGYYLRKKVHETLIKSDLKPHQVPIIEVFKNHPLSLLICIFIGSAATIPLYIITTFMNSRLAISGVITHQQMMFMNAFVLFIGTLTMPIMGWIADKVGYKAFMRFSCISLFILAYPFFIIYSFQNLYLIVCCQVLMICLNEAFVGPSNAYMSSLFPQSFRYTGVAFGYCLGLSLFGGTAPYIAGWLMKATGSETSPALCIMWGSLMGGISLLLSNTIQKKKLFLEKEDVEKDALLTSHP